MKSVIHEISWVNSYNIQFGKELHVYEIFQRVETQVYIKTTLVQALTSMKISLH